MPSADELYGGCQFADRCVMSDITCLEMSPPLEGDEHRVACFYGWDEERYEKSLEPQNID